MAKHIPIPVQKSMALQELQNAITTNSAEMEKLKQIIGNLEKEQFLEYGWLMLKQARLDPSKWVGIQTQLKLFAEKLRIIRVNRQRIGLDHLFLWLRLKIVAPAYTNSYANLQYLIGKSLMDAGLPVAMGLEKSPKPAIRLGCHLPLFTEGHNEWADVVLLGPTTVSLAELPQQINRYAPKGIYFLEFLEVHSHASPVADLCCRAHWQWTCPTELLDSVSSRIENFINSKQFNVEKINKANGQEKVLQVNIRPFFENCLWNGYNFLFQTEIIRGKATNPNKILATILGTDTSPHGLVRTNLELVDDPRLPQTDKFDIKLHNMYEDAVVLNTNF